MKTTGIKQWSDTVIHFLFPDVCMLCGRVLALDPNCSPQTKKLLICTSCLSGLPLRLENERWFPCFSNPVDGDPIPDFSVWALLFYEQNIPMLLRNLKFQSWIYAGKLIGDLMGRQFRMEPPKKWDAVVPIPLSEKRLKKRGFNQSAVLGEELAASLGVPLLPDVLIRNRHTHQQSRYQDPVLRSENVKGAFAIAEIWDIKGWNILLVDDILTTGATLHEAATVLYEAGAGYVAGVVAATHRE